MLAIKTYLDKSLIHGLGLFAAEPVAKGALVWSFNPAVDLAYSAAEWQTLKNSVTPSCFAELKKYAYKQGGKYYICFDNAQFMNHAVAESNIGNNCLDDTMYAMRDIMEGEELLCNYYEFCDADDHNLALIGPGAPVSMPGSHRCQRRK